MKMLQSAPAAPPPGGTKDAPMGRVRSRPNASSLLRPRLLEASGHLIDSGLMSKYLNVVIENGGSYELHRFDIGKTVRDFSTVEFSVSAPEPRKLDLILGNLKSLGCRLREETSVVLGPADRHGTVPDDFYSTTNYRTVVLVDGKEVEVEDQRMDGCIVV